jgi:hypothetical protein
MRYLYLPVFLFAAGLSAAALGGTDAVDVPNPFTAQPAATGNVTSTDKGVVDFAKPGSAGDAQSPQNGGFGPAPGDQAAAPAQSGDFYQQDKKEPGRR